VKRFSLKEETYIHLCKGYVKRKYHKKKFPKGWRTTNIVHSSSCGAIQIKSLGGASYVITFIDEFLMRIVIIFLMKNK